MEIAKENILHTLVWLLLILMFIAAFHYNRSGRVLEVLSGKVLECIYLPGSRAGTDMALVMLPSGKRVKVLAGQCYSCKVSERHLCRGKSGGVYVGQTRSLLKKKALFFKEIFYEFE